MPTNHQVSLRALRRSSPHASLFFASQSTCGTIPEPWPALEEPCRNRWPKTLFWWLRFFCGSRDSRKHPPARCSKLRPSRPPGLRHATELLPAQPFSISTNRWCDATTKSICHIKLVDCFDELLKEFHENRISQRVLRISTAIVQNDGRGFQSGLRHISSIPLGTLPCGFGFLTSAKCGRLLVI